MKESLLNVPKGTSSRTVPRSLWTWPELCIWRVFCSPGRAISNFVTSFTGSDFLRPPKGSWQGSLSNFRTPSRVVFKGAGGERGDRAIVGVAGLPPEKTAQGQGTPVALPSYANAPSPPLPLRITTHCPCSHLKGYRLGLQKWKLRLSAFWQGQLHAVLFASTPLHLIFQCKYYVKCVKVANWIGTVVEVVGL